MKLQYKLFAIVGLSTLAFLCAGYFTEVRYPLLNFILATLFFSLLLIYLIHILIIKQIESQLKLKNEQKKPLSDANQPIAAESVPLPVQDKDKECLAHLGRYDYLTSLPNRVFFNEILNKTISHVKRRNKILAILLVDLDSFKKINDKLGQAIGDEVLKKIGSRLGKTLRSEDILARLDGDEFIILLNDIGKPKFASAVAEKVLQICAQPMEISGKELKLTASIGIAIYPNDGDSLETLQQNVDVALVKAKQAGGANYQFYTQEMGIEAHEYIKHESALRKAIQNNELALYYQPKLHIKRGTIIGVEALTRWSHPELGNVDAAKLITLAEECGLIMQLGEWAIREACKTNKHWQDEGYEHITVAVNLSQKQFHHPDLPNIISKALKETDLHPGYLEFEIDESTAMENVEAAAKSFERIKATGVQLSIDHFGIGYTSIREIKQFPVSIIKIDKSFIKGVPHTPNDIAIVSAFIALAHSLGLEVVAEGVETAEQVQYLSSQNCDIVQGYFLSHPLCADKIIGQFAKVRSFA